MMYAAQTTSNETITTSTEFATSSTITCTGVPSGAAVVIIGMCNVATGAGTTGLTSSIREGTDTTGTEIGESTRVDISAAGDVNTIVIVVLDASTTIADQDYVVTITQNSASANGTVHLSSIVAFEVGAT